MSGNAFKLAMKSPPGAAPGNTVLPAITGTATVGNALSVSNGTWTRTPTSYAYQWTRDGSNISAATSSSYTLVTADGGTTVACIVTATNVYGSTPATSTGVSVSAGSSFNDGLSGAPSGAANYPTYLDNNAGTNALGVAIPNRPSWNVPGVDYRVGPSSSQTFWDVTSSTDRAAHLPSGFSWVAWNGSSGGYLRVDAGLSSPLTLDGWDLGPNGIYAPDAAPAITIKNCKFKAVTGRGDAVAFVQYPPTTRNGFLTVQNCLVDCDYVNAGNLAELIKGGDSGALVEYCLFLNPVADTFNAYSLYGCTSFVVRHNVMINGGAGWLNHSDFFQIQNAASGSHTQLDHWYGIEVYNNLIVQQSGDASNYPSAMNSIVRLGDMDGKNVYNPKVHHNTCLAIGANHQWNNNGTQAFNGSGMINVWQLDMHSTSEGAGEYVKDLELHDNYFFSNDTGRAATDRCLTGYHYQNNNNNTAYTMSNNVKMWDGTTFPNTLPGQ